MKKIFGSPSRYIQGAGVMQDLSAYAEVLGSKPAIIIDPEVNELIGDMVKGSFQQKDKPYYLEILGEESPRICCHETIDLFREKANAADCDLIIGIGGGGRPGGEIAVQTANGQDFGKFGLPKSVFCDLLRK